MIYSCAVSEGLSKLKVHAMRPDGTAACSNYLLVVRGAQAYTIPTPIRCTSRACQKLFAEADRKQAKTSPATPASKASRLKDPVQREIAGELSEAGNGTPRTIARHARGRGQSMCRQVTEEERTHLAGYKGATIGLWDPSVIAKAALGEEPTPETLFAYCYRRFGQPLCSTDPDKGLASYLLTTPMAGVLLVVNIRAPGCSAGSFGYLVEGDIFWSALREYEAANLARAAAFERWLARCDAAPVAGKQARAAAWREFDTQHPRRDQASHRGLLGKVYRALRASIKDLARPTSVRDAYFNALGPVDDVRAPIAPFDPNAVARSSA